MQNESQTCGRREVALLLRRECGGIQREHRTTTGDGRAAAAVAAAAAATARRSERRAAAGGVVAANPVASRGRCRRAQALCVDIANALTSGDVGPRDRAPTRRSARHVLAPHQFAPAERAGAPSVRVGAARPPAPHLRVAKAPRPQVRLQLDGGLHRLGRRRGAAVDPHNFRRPRAVRRAAVVPRHHLRGLQLDDRERSKSTSRSAAASTIRRAGRRGPSSRR